MDNGGCAQTCTNTVGSYTCSCTMAGYVLFDVNGRSGYFIQTSETGNMAGDVYRLGHSCVRKYWSSLEILIVDVCEIDKIFKSVKFIKYLSQVNKTLLFERDSFQFLWKIFFAKV